MLGKASGEKQVHGALPESETGNHQADYSAGRSDMENLVRMKEADVQRLILDWLAAEKIWHMRLNTGAMSGSYKGKSWYVRFGKPGMADIVATRRWVSYDIRKVIAGAPIEPDIVKSVVYWIEVKSPKGIQSPDQKRFQSEVEAEGMTYILAKSLEDVTKVLA